MMTATLVDEWVEREVNRATAAILSVNDATTDKVVLERVRRAVLDAHELLERRIRAHIAGEPDKTFKG